MPANGRWDLTQCLKGYNSVFPEVTEPHPIKCITMPLVDITTCRLHIYHIYSIQGIPGGKVNILGGHSIRHSKQKSVHVCVLFQKVDEIETWFNSSLDWAFNTVWSTWIDVKRQLAVVSVDRDVVRVLWKMPHIFTNAKYAVRLQLVRL
jgi:hypothetical protein